LVILEPSWQFSAWRIETVLVARRFAFFNFNLKAGGADFAALGLRWPRAPGNKNGGKRKITRHGTRGIYCLPPEIATCYPGSVNRNIFYIIGVIVVIVIVLKVLGVF
jgi:hypothetical protein